MADYDIASVAQIVASNENIKNYKLEYNYSSNKGDGYTGTVKAVTIKGSNKSLDLVFKYSHRDPAAHENIPLRVGYLNEIHFYAVIEPTFKKFQERYNIKNPFNNTPQYYYGTDEPFQECLVLENIKKKNFDLWDKSKPMNREHLESALKAFAKFHGTSFAMKQLDADGFAKICLPIHGNIWQDFIRQAKLFEQHPKNILNMDLFNKNNEKEKLYFDKLEDYRTNMDKFMLPVVGWHDEYDVILQGDCWSNNAMYKYKDLNDRSTPEDVILLDWQVIKTGPVVLDLAYFFYTIASKESLDNIEHFLKIYHGALKQHLEEFGLDVNDVYPYQKFFDHWKKVALFGMMQAFMLRKMNLTTPENAPDFADDICNLIMNIRLSKDDQELYRKNMKEIVMHFVDNQFL